MKNNNVLQDKSYAFALKIIQLYLQLKSNHEYILGKQLLKSGTSIGANVEEAIGAYSEKDFLFKIGIAYREARESHYWIRLLRDSEHINSETAIELINDVEELLKIIGSIQATIKRKQLS